MAGSAWVNSDLFEMEDDETLHSESRVPLEQRTMSYNTYVEPEHSDVEDGETSRSMSNISLEKSEEFIEQRGKDIHPIFDIPKVAMPDVPGSPKKIEFRKSTKAQIQEFLQSINSIQSSGKDNDKKFEDLCRESSWNEMIKSAKLAQDAYEKAGDKRLRKIGRWVAGHSEMALPVLRIIPNDFNASIIYGGLRLVFEALGRVDKSRLEVLQSFLRIPNIMFVAESCVRNYPLDDELYQKAEDVLCAALPAIEGAISWVKGRPIGRPLRAIVRGSAYNKDFKERMHDLNYALTQLQEHAALLSQQSIRNVEEIVRRTGTRLESMAEAQDKTHAKVDYLYDLEQIRRDATKALQMVLAEKLKNTEWKRQKDRLLHRLANEVKELSKADIALTVDDLQDILNVGTSLSYDLRQVQLACKSLDLEVIQETRSIIESKRMSKWLMEDAASALFIEGGSTLSHGRHTPLSFLSSEIIKGLHDSEPAVCVYFFCGLHTSSRDPLRGPAGVMRSLITQILNLCPPKLDFISKRYRKQLEDLHIHTLCDCFCKLVRRLPTDLVLFCIIDGISFIEKSEWANNCRDMMNQLQGLLEDDNISAVFKLLVTSPTRSRYVGSSFSEECQMVISSDRSNVAQHRLTERELALRGSRPWMYDSNGSRFPKSTRPNKYSRDAPSYQSQPEHHSDWDDDPAEKSFSQLELQAKTTSDSDWHEDD